MSILVEQAQLVFDLFQTPENKLLLISVFRNLLSLSRRCKSNENIKFIFLQNMRILEIEVELQPEKSKLALNRFKSTLQTILEPCYKLPHSRKLKKLSGPCSFTFFSEPNLKILILGEVHDLENICKKSKHYEVQDWLFDLSMDAPECLDIFLEEDMNSHQRARNIPRFKNVSSPLEAILEQFDDLLKQKQISHTTRSHFVDVRTCCKDNKYFDKLVQLALDQALDEKDNQDFNHRWNLDLPKIRNYYLGFESSKNRDSYELMTRQYISEVFQMVYNYSISPNDLDDMHEEMEKVRSLIKRQLRKSLLFVPKIKEVLTKWNLSNLLSILNNGLDIFLLIRVFSKFDKSKMNRGPLYCQMFQYPKNLIIYCGDAHQEFITFFVKEYFGIIPKKQLKCGTSKCLQFNPSFDFFESNDQDVIEI